MKRIRETADGGPRSKAQVLALLQQSGADLDREIVEHREHLQFAATLSGPGRVSYTRRNQLDLKERELKLRARGLSEAIDHLIHQGK